MSARHKMFVDKMGMAFFCIFLFGLLNLMGGCEGFGEQIVYNEAERVHDAGDFARAIRLYEKLLKDDPENIRHPDNANVLFDLGVAYIDIGNRRKADEQRQKLEAMGEYELAGQIKRLLLVADNLPPKK